MFEKTLRALEKFKDSSSQIAQLLQTEGVSAQFAEVKSKDGLNSISLPNGAMLECFAHLKSLPYKTFEQFGAPQLHFCNCAEFAKLLDSQNPHLLLRRAGSNAFEFSVYQGGTTTGYFRDYPLPLCTQCIEIAKNLPAFAKHTEDSQEFEKYLFLFMNGEKV
ncbi:hypothetical protein CQA49_05910 [Helicobacter sp. MIT 00-7814]|uniref:hypothetical protein n=1 Tax=unclassified Helicobacter TaxID=2593540 RepID=UPI000E1EE0CC|nr:MULTISPECIES: hypothetical protein [unclassified Helicobacter]RDU53935.1 hypothetical protein CQA49_05910 [Helicobacter sp. MIT 00-7814]RDU57065.1 hypothetical protein CQA37_01270 [Helicobacter sp. MIT 99-10781]